MPFLDYVLQPPSYGWRDKDGIFIKPSSKQMLRESLLRINIINNRKNWLPLFSWFSVLVMVPFSYCSLFGFCTGGRSCQHLFTE